MTGSAGSLAERVAAIAAGVADAATLAHRRVSDITTIVVTKFHPIELIQELFALGVNDFGESRHPEARLKAEALGKLGITWHFVGQLQANKAKLVAHYADVIHSVDRDSLVDSLHVAVDGSGQSPVSCFLQVNLTDDPGRGGVDPSHLLRLADHISATALLNLLGVMAVAPLGEEPRRAFARLRGYSEQLQNVAPEAVSISAGMSEDYREAILEGATHLRIGTAITGNRPPPG